MVATLIGPKGVGIVIMGYLATGQAILDTSFWSLACVTGLEPYLWIYWSRLITTTTVQSELFHAPVGAVQQTKFQQALHTGQMRIQDPTTLIPTLSKGEQSVVSLALELQAPALIDDFRAHHHADQQYNVSAISVAQCVILLLRKGILSLADSESIVLQLKQTGATSPVFLQWAAQQIHRQGGRLLWP